MFYCGLDLGQTNDSTALTIARRIPTGATHRYAIPWLQRFKLGTSYPEIVSEVSGRLTELRRANPETTIMLIIDATGVGRPVVDMFRLARIDALIYDVTIHGGDTVTHEGMSWRVPKRDLVSTVQTLLQQKRLDISTSLRETPTLLAELKTFTYKIDPHTAHDSYNARSGAHDDMLLATALALFGGENFSGGSVRLITWGPDADRNDDDDRGWQPYGR